MIDCVKDLPALPQTGMELINLINNHTECSAQDIVRVVQTDPVLSAKLLRICNSAAYGFATPINSVRQAVLAMGFVEVERLAIALSFGGVMQRSLGNYEIDGEQFWLHSLSVGFGAEALAKTLPQFRCDSASAYTAGILHDIGKLVMNSVLAPSLTSDIRRLIELEGCSRCDAERCVLGVEHSEVGACLLETWRLPQPLIDAVRDHHQPAIIPKPALSVLVHLADCISHQFGSAPGWDGCAIRVDETAAASVGFGPEHHQNAMMAAFDQVERARQFANSI